MNRCITIALIALSLLALSIRPPRADGQSARRDAALTSLKRGVSALEKGENERALSLLEETSQKQPDLYDDRLGSAAYWLGAAYDRVGLSERARESWADGWVKLVRRNIVDMRLGDALLWSVFTSTDESRYELASNAYLTMLKSFDEPGHPHGAVAKARILEPLLFILPDSIRGPSIRVDEQNESVDLEPGGGQRLAEWWYAQDGLPASAAVERLIDHLTRVAFAQSNFMNRDGTALDDRGEIFIRFGPPSRSRAVRVNEMSLMNSDRFTDTGLRIEVSPHAIRFASNEFWVYSQVHDEAQYLFIRRANGEYRLGTSYDLVPGELRRPSRSRQLLKVMENILWDLSIYHPLAYGNAYMEVSHYRIDLEMQDLARYHDNVIATTFGSGARTGLRVPLVSRTPRDFVWSKLITERSRERQLARSRDEEVPQAYFDDLKDVELLPVFLRTARFLEPDGTTRLDLFWTVLSADLRPSKNRLKQLKESEFGAPDAYRVDFSVVEYDRDYESRVRHVVKRLVEKSAITDDGVLTAQTFSIRRLGSTNVALQWDVVPIQQRDTIAHAGPKVKISSGRVLDLEPLNADRARLEISDLKPLHRIGPAFVEPYVPSALGPNVQLGLYFELYHLKFGADDRTHYTVSYEMRREENLAFRTRARQEPKSQQISASTEYRGDSSNTKEAIYLDLTDWKTSGDLEIEVRVRDEVSGEEVSRTIDFEMVVKS